MLRSQTSLSANLESAQDLLQVEEVARNTPSQSSGPFKSLLEWREKYIVASPYAALEKLKAERDPPKKNSIFMMAGGAAGAADALDGYLRFLEPTSRDDWLKYVHILGVFIHYLVCPSRWLTYWFTTFLMLLVVVQNV